MRKLLVRKRVFKGTLNTKENTLNAERNTINITQYTQFLEHKIM